MTQLKFVDSKQHGRIKTT